MTSSNSSSNISSDFKNVTISGGVGVGTTTLMKNLMPFLEPLGFSFTSTGMMMRERMQEYKNPRADLLEDEVHKKVEKDTYEILAAKKPYVIEGWLSGFIARDLQHTLRIYVFASEDSVRVDRIVNRDHMTVQEARDMIRDREDANFKMWKNIYGDFNFWDPKYYHVSIDTCLHGQNETVGKVLDVLGYTPMSSNIFR
ncbi:cytidylate kinase family protein [Candidatus Woesebacteria bacterium]|nr:cytidylate kinase family protein [Candidatus Woesebacteria bacterium]